MLHVGAADTDEGGGDRSGGRVMTATTAAVATAVVAGIAQPSVPAEAPFAAVAFPMASGSNAIGSAARNAELRSRSSLSARVQLGHVSRWADGGRQPIGERLALG
jgi:hypothetical protein